jgi:hypothetical protein
LDVLPHALFQHSVCQNNGLQAKEKDWGKKQQIPTKRGKVANSNGEVGSTIKILQWPSGMGNVRSNS